METRNHCAYNKTRETLLSLGVTFVDTTRGPFNALIEEATLQAGKGLWLTPFRGIPVGQRLPLFDLVYLDENHRVLEGVECFAAMEFAPLSIHPASGLVLPPHTLSMSQTRAGDQLLICVAEDMVRLLARVEVSSASAVGENRDPAPAASLVACLPEPVAIELPWQPPATGRKPEEEKADPKAKGGLSLMARFRRWLDGDSDRRRAVRHPLPGLVAYYWTGGPPRPYSLGDISTSGFFLITDERWTPGTIIQMTLQRTDTERGAEDVVSVQSRVVRWAADGVGFQFVLADVRGQSLPGQGTDKEVLERFLERLDLPEKKR